MGRHALPPHKRKRRYWFVLACELGMDSRVKKDLRKAVKLNNMEKQIGRIVIPRKPQQVWIKDKEVTQMRMCFPGYLIVHCKFTDDVFHLIGGIQGSYGLLMNPREPIPLTSQEEAHVFIKEKIMKETCQPKQESVSFKWKEGDEIMVVNNGPWHGFQGKVVKVQNDCAVVELMLMGREVTMSFRENELSEDFAP